MAEREERQGHDGAEPAIPGNQTDLLDGKAAVDK